VPTPSIHFGARSEITDFSQDGLGAQSEITEYSNATYSSQTPFARFMNRSRADTYVPSTISYRSRFSRHHFSLSTGLVKPVGQFSRNVKDRSKFVWELIKLNYRMLISLTLTLFVAIFVSTPLRWFLNVDFGQFFTFSA
jgi:hypothetical protein